MNHVLHFYLLCFMDFVLVLSCENNNYVVKEVDKQSVRKERALLFPPSSTIGILAAIAVPLDDRKNVFMSYNFEANYNSPYLASQYIPGPLTRLDLARSSGVGMSSVKVGNDSLPMIENTQKFIENGQIEGTTTSRPPKATRSLVTRTNLYKSIERKLNAAGYNGHDCLLRTICEAAEIPLGLHNGVLGDLMHIIFTPSSSAKENILYDFYDAEIHGTINMCKHYSKNCPQSIFDWISIFE